RPQPAGEEKPEAGEPASPAPAAAQELAADKPETTIAPPLRAANDTLERPAADLRLFDQIPHALVLRRPEGGCRANAEFLRLTGYSSCEEFLLAGGLEAVFSDSRSQEDEVHASRQRLALRKRDGSDLPCEATLKTVSWEGSKALLLSIR